jgi:hypothetical protein
MSPLFVFFKDQFGILPGAGMVGLLAIGTALLGLWKMEETFGKDLNFVEESRRLDATTPASLKHKTAVDK